METDDIANPSGNPAFSDILEQHLSRRTVLAAGAGVAAAAFLGGFGGGTAMASGGSSTPKRRPIGFTGVPSPTTPLFDGVTVPEGYVVDVLVRHGDPITGSYPAYMPDASNTSHDQEQQFGSHCDGMALFKFNRNLGMLAVNNEYADDGLLHVGGMTPWTAEKVRKAQAAHGVSIVKISKKANKSWEVLQSSYNRRISTLTPTQISGPAAGHALLQTAEDPTGTWVTGILNQCASGPSPWGTYLTSEENFDGYFGGLTAAPTADQARYSINATGFGYRWFEHDARFNPSLHPNEPHRFGWITEIDPMRPDLPPVKRTALGRIKHEGATAVTAKDGKVAIYSGDDQIFEYVYKYVSADRWRKMRRRGESPLDRGTLYVARFNADGTGEWLPLVHGVGPLTAENGFPDQATVLVRTRQAADAVGATKMDRPEWIAHDQVTGQMYVTCTNNSRRGTGTNPAPDAANPRVANIYGHIVRWTETAGHSGTTFAWEIFILAGDPALGAASAGTVVGDAFGSPDGIKTDPLGRLWIQTDASPSQQSAATYANLRANVMLVADTETRETRRFLIGPPNCEITGAEWSPDNRAMFVGIQHPGEPPSFLSDPANPSAFSSWPDGPGNRPRSSVIVIRRADGGIIGD
jgi:uncharacterized protein